MWRSRMRLILMILAVSTIWSLLEIPALSQEPQIWQAVDTILWWLPTDTETILFAKGPLPPKRLAPPKAPGQGVITEYRVVNGQSVVTYRDAATGKVVPPPPPPPSPHLAQFMVRFFTFEFSRLPGFTEDHFAKQSLLFAIMTGRKFKLPTGIPGGPGFEGCQIAVFKDEIRKEAIAALERHSSRVSNVAGFRVFEVDNPDKKNNVSYFVQPKPNVLLAANDLDTLTTCLGRIAQRGSARALPDTLPEWKLVDTNSSAWGVRHFRTSTIGDKKAVGLTFSWHQSSKSVSIYYLLSAPNLEEIATKVFKKLVGDKIFVKKSGEDAVLVQWKTGNQMGAFGGHELLVLALMGWEIFL